MTATRMTLIVSPHAQGPEDDVINTFYVPPGSPAEVAALALVRVDAHSLEFQLQWEENVELAGSNRDVLDGLHAEFEEAVDGFEKDAKTLVESLAISLRGAPRLLPEDAVVTRVLIVQTRDLGLDSQMLFA